MKTYYFWLVIGLHSCSAPFYEDISEDPPLSNSKIDARLVPYLLSFEQAALSQGIQIDLAKWDITAEIKQIKEEDIAGLCQYNNRNSDRYISIDADFWANSSTAYKEYIVFHELGHCILKRNHLEGCRTDGSYLSLMRSGHGGCKDRYSSATRNYYIQELFGGRHN